MSKMAVLTISDRCFNGRYKDKSGRIILKMIKEIGIEVVQYDIIPDEIDAIKERLIHYADSLRLDLVITTGGTGLSPRDLTPEATREISQRIVPGISEYIRLVGIRHTKNAMLSRGMSVIRNNTLIINLPGNPKAVRQAMESILDILSHTLDMLRGESHPC